MTLKFVLPIPFSRAFLYTNTKLSETEIQKTITFTMASRRIKYLGINLTKEVKDLYTKHCKTLVKEIEYTTNILFINQINEHC